MRVNLKGQSVGSDPGLEAAVDVEAEALEAAPSRVMLLPQPCPHRPRRVCRPQPFLPHPLLPAHTTRVSPRRPVTRTSSSSARRQHTRQRQQPQDKSGVGGAREERGCGGGACVGGVKCRGTGGGRGPGPRGSGGERACRRRGPTHGSCPPRPHSPPLHTLTHSTERERERERERREVRQTCRRGSGSGREQCAWQQQRGRRRRVWRPTGATAALPRPLLLPAATLPRTWDVPACALPLPTPEQSHADTKRARQEKD